MKLKQYPTATQFLEESLACLAKEEALNSLLLGLALANTKKGKEDNSLYLTVSKNDKIQLAALQTVGRRFIASTKE